MKSVTALLLVVLAAIVAGGAVYLFKPSTDVDVSVTIERMRDIAELATTEYTITSVVERPFASKGLFGKEFRSDFEVRSPAAVGYCGFW